jgi:hypothetical protein
VSDAVRGVCAAATVGGACGAADRCAQGRVGAVDGDHSRGGCPRDRCTRAGDRVQRATVGDARATRERNASEAVVVNGCCQLMRVARLVGSTKLGVVERGGEAGRISRGCVRPGRVGAVPVTARAQIRPPRAGAAAPRAARGGVHASTARVRRRDRRAVRVVQSSLGLPGAVAVGLRRRRRRRPAATGLGSVVGPRRRPAVLRRVGPGRASTAPHRQDQARPRRAATRSGGAGRAGGKRRASAGRGVPPGGQWRRRSCGPVAGQGVVPRHQQPRFFAPDGPSTAIVG